MLLPARSPSSHLRGYRYVLPRRWSVCWQGGSNVGGPVNETSLHLGSSLPLFSLASSVLMLANVPRNGFVTACGYTKLSQVTGVPFQGKLRSSCAWPASLLNLPRAALNQASRLSL